MPTVFAAHGLTLTAAFELALACDILLAAEKASFGLVEIVVGLTPSMGGPQRLAERAGPARARELIFTGERYPAAVLERWNVVNRVLPDEGFAAAAREYAHRVAAGPTVAHAATKRLVATSVRDGARAADALVPEVSGRAVRHRGPARGGRLLPHRRAREGDLLRAVSRRAVAGRPMGRSRDSGCPARVDSTGPQCSRAHARSRKAGSRVLARHLPRRPRARRPHVP